MNIPFHKKENPNDCGCAPVCLQMAFAYYDLQRPIEEIYRLCGSIGETNYTLPWGMCLAAMNEGLHATFISKNPKQLLESSILDIGQMTGKSTVEIKELTDLQIQKCERSASIRLLNWNDCYIGAPERVIREGSGVIIPTIWWGNQPHNIVITSWTGEEIQYHDPNADMGNHTMQTNRFFHKWLHDYTDNDLLIISKVRINSIILTGNSATIAATQADMAEAKDINTAKVNLPIIDKDKKILWGNIFQSYAIPSTEGELRQTKYKDWSLSILKDLKEDIPTIPLESNPDPLDEKTLLDLIEKYRPHMTSTKPEIDLLKIISENLHNANDYEIFFLLYKLIE